MNKRGDVSTTLNWVFVSIVGVILLTFFAGFIVKQRDFADRRVTAKVLNDMDLITVGAQASKGTMQIIDLPKTELRFTCDDCDCNFFVGDLQKPYADKLIFSPNYLRGREALAWSLDWSAPYRVTNFLYFTSTQARYILTYPGKSEPNYESMEQFVLNLQDTIPEEITGEFREYDSTSPPEDLNNYKVRFVYFGREPAPGDLINLQRMEDEDVTALHVPATATRSKGSITFYQKSGNAWSIIQNVPTYYINEEALLAAIFSEDPFIYRCNMQKAFRRLEATSKIYRDRADELVDYYQSPEIAGTGLAECAIRIAATRTSMDIIRDSAGQLARIFSVPETDAATPVNAIVNDIVSAQARLAQDNQNVQYFSCPEVY